MTSKQVTSPPWNSRRLVHNKEMVWASRWSVALRAFYRQILSLTYSFLSLKLLPPACPGTTGILSYLDMHKTSWNKAHAALIGFNFWYLDASVFDSSRIFEAGSHSPTWSTQIPPSWSVCQDWLFKNLVSRPKLFLCRAQPQNKAQKQKRHQASLNCIKKKPNQKKWSEVEVDNLTCLERSLSNDDIIWHLAQDQLVPHH